MSVEDRWGQHNCWRVLARVILLCLITSTYFPIGECEFIDMGLHSKSNVVREEFNASFWIIDAAPVSPIRLQDKFNAVRVELDVSACAMDAAPVSPILLTHRFNVVSKGSLRARRRSWSENLSSKLC